MEILKSILLGALGFLIVYKAYTRYFFTHYYPWLKATYKDGQYDEALDIQHRNGIKYYALYMLCVLLGLISPLMLLPNTFGLLAFAITFPSLFIALSRCLQISWLEGNCIFIGREKELLYKGKLSVKQENETLFHYLRRELYAGIDFYKAQKKASSLKS